MKSNQTAENLFELQKRRMIADSARMTFAKRTRKIVKYCTFTWPSPTLWPNYD